MNPFIEIDWHDGWANMPELIVHEAAVPLSYFVFTQKGCLYYGCDKISGQVSYFGYSEPGSGYGGHKFTLHMDDNTEKELIGPWSSRASVMNTAGFPHCVECVYVDQFGHRSSGAILISRAKELLENSGLAAYYEQVDDHHEIGYDIVASSDIEEIESFPKLDMSVCPKCGDRLVPCGVGRDNKTMVYRCPECHYDSQEVESSTRKCYQCDKPVDWLAPDSRCGDCTRYTPGEITGEDS